MSWGIERAPGSRARRTDDGCVAVPLRLSRNGDHATDVDLVLSLADAEHLHASLCRALDGHPALPSAPDCRSESTVGLTDAHRADRGAVTRSIITAAEWTLGPEASDHTPEAIYSVVCLSCSAASTAMDNERLPVEVWALKHTGLNPDHRQFKATVETFWRVCPAEGNPYREKEAQSTRALR
jgi:hypothetical protein